MISVFFDANKTTELELLVSGKKIGMAAGNKLNNPLILIANYLFDSLPSDVLRIGSDKLQAVKFPESFFLKGEKEGQGEVKLGDYSDQCVFEDISLPYYNEGAIDYALKQYKECKVSGEFSFFFPNRVFMCLDRVRENFSEQILILSADKCYNSIKHMEMLDEPATVGTHGEVISVMFNAHALGYYAEYYNGSSVCHEDVVGGLDIAVTSVGFDFAQMPRTKLSVSDGMAAFLQVTYLLYLVI